MFEITPLYPPLPGIKPLVIYPSRYGIAVQYGRYAEQYEPRIVGNSSRFRIFHALWGKYVQKNHREISKINDEKNEEAYQRLLKEKAERWAGTYQESH